MDMKWLIILVIGFIIIKSIYTFISGEMNRRFKIEKGQFSVEVFIVLFVIYLTLIIGFGLIYFLISLQLPVIFGSADSEQVTVIDLLGQSFYFSGITLLTIGYGDIIPVGLGRFIAIIQGIIGYLLPTAFVIRLVIEREKGK